MSRISTVKEFLEKVKVGDTIYTITSYGDKPSEVLKFKVLRIGESDDVFPRFRSVNRVSGICACVIDAVFVIDNRAYIDDLVNPWHGVFTSLEEAEEYLNAITSGSLPYPAKD